MIWLLAMKTRPWCACLFNELNHDSETLLHLYFYDKGTDPQPYTKIYQVKVDYDWLTWKYTIRRWRLHNVTLQWTDFDNEWRAKCFLKYILTKQCREVIEAWTLYD